MQHRVVRVCFIFFVFMYYCLVYYYSIWIETDFVEAEAELAFAIEAEKVAPDDIVVGFGDVEVAIGRVDSEAEWCLDWGAIGDEIVVDHLVGETIEGANPALVGFIIVAIHVGYIVVNNHLERMNMREGVDYGVDVSIDFME